MSKIDKKLSKEMMVDLRTFDFAPGIVFTYLDPRTSHNHTLIVKEVKNTSEVDRELICQVVSSSSPDLPVKSKFGVSFSIQGAPVLGFVINNGLDALPPGEQAIIVRASILQNKTLAQLRMMPHTQFKEKISVLVDGFTFQGILDETQPENIRKKQFLQALSMKKEIFRSAGGYIQLIKPDATSYDLTRWQDGVNNNFPQGQLPTVIRIDKAKFLEHLVGLIDSLNVVVWE